MNELFTIAKVVSTHGVNGEIKVFTYTNISNRFKDIEYVYIDNIKIRLLNAKKSSKFDVLKLEGYDSIDKALTIIKKDIMISKSDRYELQDDEFYISDIIGFRCQSTNGENLGILKDVLVYSCNDCLVINNNEKEILVPVVKEFIKNVDLENKTITIELMEGLIW